MSQVAVLREVFRKVYGLEFDPENKDHREMLQSAIYLLDQMGVKVGNYDFYWEDCNNS